ncbi:MAG: T9SS type A sorting domain-containing protein [Bacteroidales bacterium]|nr:T9SS type A sorting domain-containing protein [Bacteroidales bacterium]
MKKTLLFAFALLFATATMAQNRAVLLQESFDGATMPAGWTINGQPNNWSVSTTNNAGGEANEMHLSWSPQFSGTTRLVSPAIDLTGVSSVVFSFKHALDNYQGSNTIGVATSSDGGTTWNTGWSQGYSANNAYSVSQTINTPDMGQANVKFCIYFSGSSYNINDWFFDDIKIFTLEELDLGLEAALLPPYIGNGETNFGIKVFNYGTASVTSVEATYQVEGMEPVTETFSTNIASLGTTNLNFTAPTLLMPGSYNVSYSINLVNGETDNNANNNTLSKAVSVAYGTTDRTPMIEHFSSSTCGPCVQPNVTMNNFCNNNQGRYTYTKYQMNWPGNGDPYYTAEGGTRRDYYSVNAVPLAFLDAESLNFGGVQNQFNQHAEIPSFMDVRGSFTVDGNTISVVADVMPYINVNARVYVSVNEKETHGNVGSNGETTFHHVFMKMLPNAQGSTIDFVAGELQRLEFTQDLSATHVEEMSDLEVAIWVQNHGTKEIFNSHYAYDYSDIHPYPVENLALVENEGNMMTASWDAPAQGEPIGYNVYVNDELVAENTTETTYSFDAEPGVFYVVGVVALYAEEKTSVKSVAAPGSGMQDEGLVVVGSSNVILDIENPSLDLSVQNANLGTMTPIQISSITEGVSEGGPYLNIELASELPAMVEAGEEFHFTISPINTGERSYASTSVNVNYDGGTINFLVEIDGELLSVTEITSQAKIYPNPTSGNVRVMAGSNIESVKVYDMLGALVAIVPANGTSVDVNMSQFSNGVYFFNIRQSDGTVSNQRVVVNH